jgi:hypothetical protein
MAFTASILTGELGRKLSIGGAVNIELQSFSCLTSDTAGTVTAVTLSRVDQVVLLAPGTICQTAAPSISGNVATLALADPAAACTGYVAKGVNGLVMLIGK